MFFLFRVLDLDGALPGFSGPNSEVKVGGKDLSARQAVVPDSATFSETSYTTNPNINYNSSKVNVVVNATEAVSLINSTNSHVSVLLLYEVLCTFSYCIYPNQFVGGSDQTLAVRNQMQPSSPGIVFIKTPANLTINCHN